MAGQKEEIWVKALALATILQVKKATASVHIGTNFGPPFRWAQDQFKENPRADFLFITDGMCVYRGREKKRVHSGEEPLRSQMLAMAERRIRLAIRARDERFMGRVPRGSRT